VSTDSALVARVLDGDVEAYSELVRRYHAPCVRFAFRMLGNREDAEDAVQEAFIRAYRALGRYRERDMFRSWLYRIVSNQCRTTAKVRRRLETRFQSQEAVALHADPAAEPREELVQDALMRALADLEPLLREAFLLKHVEGLAYEEMTQVTGASIPALKMRVKRARDVLRPRLEAIYDA
jgi:RNA polymerase sigma-70 factor (ECF subfamily)